MYIYNIINFTCYKEQVQLESNIFYLIVKSTSCIDVVWLTASCSQWILQAQNENMELMDRLKSVFVTCSYVCVNIFPAVLRVSSANVLKLTFQNYFLSFYHIVISNYCARASRAVNALNFFSVFSEVFLTVNSRLFANGLTVASFSNSF